MSISLTSTPQRTLSNNNASRYVAGYNPILFTFTASSSPVPEKIKIQIFDASDDSLIITNDLIYFFTTSKTFTFDASPYLRAYFQRTLWSDFTTSQFNDTSALIKFYLKFLINLFQILKVKIPKLHITNNQENFFVFLNFYFQ